MKSVLASPNAALSHNAFPQFADVEHWAAHALNAAGAPSLHPTPPKEVFIYTARHLVAVDDSPETAENTQRYVTKHPQTHRYAASQEAQIALLKFSLTEADKLLLVGHNNGDAMSQVVEQIADSLEHAPRKVSLLTCAAAAGSGQVDPLLQEYVESFLETGNEAEQLSLLAALVDEDSPPPAGGFHEPSLVSRTHAAFLGRSTVSGHSVGMCLDADGHRRVDRLPAVKLSLGVVRQESLPCLGDAGQENMPWLPRGKGKAKPAAPAPAIAPAPALADQPVFADKRPGFVGPINKARIWSTPAGVDSASAHRLSFENMKRSIEHTGWLAADDMIRKVTIPCRDFGTIKKGDERYYKLVMSATSHDMRLKFLNSSPFNLRPGDASTNSSLGSTFDPHLTPNGSLTPTSEQLEDEALDANDINRSSSFLGKLEMANYETKVVELLSKYRPNHNPNWYQA